MSALLGMEFVSSHKITTSEEIKDLICFMITQAFSEQATQQSGFKRYFSNTSWLIGEKIINMMISFFVGVYVARYLGPERLGLLSYSQSFVMLFAPIFNLGLDTIVVRELVKDGSSRDVLLGTCFGLRILGVLVVWIMLASVVPFTNNDSYTNILIIIIAGSLLFQSFGAIDFYFQAKVLSKYAVWARMLAGIIIPVIKVGMVLAQAQLVWFAWVILLQSLIVCIFFMMVYHSQKLSVFRWKFDRVVAKQLLKDSWPLMFASLMIVIYMKIDQVMLKNMTDATQVGIYAVAVRISEVWYFIPVLITQSIFPAVINGKRGDTGLYQRRMQQLYDLMTFLSLTIAIVITFSSSLIMNTLFGQAYLGSDKVLAIHIWAGVLVFFGTARSKWIIAENLQRKAIIAHISGAVLNVILNLFLIPSYGAVGAALATLFSYGVNTVITSMAIREFRGPFILYMRSFFHFITLKTIRQIVTRTYVV